MVSEKSRYIYRNDDPIGLYDMNDFAKQLPMLGSDRLSSILAIRAEYDQILNKILSISLSFQNPIVDLKTIMAALNNAIHIPELVSDSEGHEQILDEIFWQIERLAQNGNYEFAKLVAKYSLERGQEMLENFEEGFSWNCSLKEIENWLASNGEKK